MTRRSRLLRVVETSERLPPALQPPFWGALLGLAVTAGLALASVPLWLLQGRGDIPAAVLDMVTAGLLAGAVGGAIALVLAGRIRKGSERLLASEGGKLRAVRDIGTWYAAFSLTSAVSVMTNCALLAMDKDVQAFMPDATDRQWILGPYSLFILTFP